MKSYLNRDDFPMLLKKIDGNDIVYLDNAATTHKPQSVIDAITNFYTNEYATTGRGVYPLAEQATQMYDDARKKVAQFINAQKNSEIVFTSGATDSITMAAHAWALNNIIAGDEIVLSELEHHANILPWQYVAQQTSAQLRFIPVTKNGDLDYVALDSVITSRTKLVAVMHTSNALGTHVNLEKIIAHAKNVGAKVLIDASQAMIHQKVDVQKLGCDFFAFSGHKMFGPTGIGVLYVNQELHDQLMPFRRGGGMVFSADYHAAQWAQMPQLLQAGTPPIAQIIGLGAAIEYIDKNINWSVLAAHESALTSYAIERLQKIEGIKLLGPIESLQKNGHQISFIVKNAHAHDVAAFLGSYGICVRAGHHCAQPLAQKIGYIASVRASFAGYNVISEVDFFVNALQRVISG